jgi:hypothetical protein
MVNLELLTRRGLRAYEFGRLRMAARIALLLGPMLVVCVGTAPDKRTCACLSLVLLVVAVGLRWRSRSYAREVRLGLLAGTVPMLMGVALALTSPASRALSLALLANAGLVCGMWIAARKRHVRPSAPGSTVAVTIAILTSGVATLPLGLLDWCGVILGMTLGLAALHLQREG